MNVLLNDKMSRPCQNLTQTEENPNILKYQVREYYRTICFNLVLLLVALEDTARYAGLHLVPAKSFGFPCLENLLPGELETSGPRSYC